MTSEIKKGPEKQCFDLYEYKPRLLKYLKYLGVRTRKLPENIALLRYFRSTSMTIKTLGSYFGFTTDHVRLQKLWNSIIQEVAVLLGTCIFNRCEGYCYTQYNYLVF